MDKVILSVEAVEDAVKKLHVSKLESVGTREWFTNREAICQLYQMSALQARNMEDEVVKEVVEETNQLSFFIEESIVISVWKEKVLSEMLKLSPEAEHTFPCYLIMYHEGMLIGMLQTMLFHAGVCSKLGDSALDLIDYAVEQLSRLDPKREPVIKADFKEGEQGAFCIITVQERVISHCITAQCVGILRYLAENVGDLVPGAERRLYDGRQDLPVLISMLLSEGAWRYKDECNQEWRFCDTAWREWGPADPPLGQTEIQAWLLLRQLLLTPTMSYPISSHRVDSFSRLLRLLTEPVLDMLSPLVELKDYITRLQLQQLPTSSVPNPLILELHDSLYVHLSEMEPSYFQNLAKERARLLFYGGPEEIQMLAKSMADTFSMLDEVSDAIRTCHNCFAKATKKCSQCKKVWYCSRECQVQHWRSHKTLCFKKINC